MEKELKEKMIRSDQSPKLEEDSDDHVAAALESLIPEVDMNGKLCTSVFSLELIFHYPQLTV